MPPMSDSPFVQARLYELRNLTLLGTRVRL